MKHNTGKDKGGDVRADYSKALPGTYYSTKSKQIRSRMLTQAENDEKGGGQFSSHKRSGQKV